MQRQMLKEILNNYSKKLGINEIKDCQRERQRMDWEGGI